MAGTWGAEGPDIWPVRYCLRHHSVRKLKYIPCFEVRLSPKDLTHPQIKVYTFAFHGLTYVTIQCVCYYKMRALVQNACATTKKCVHNYKMRALLLATKKLCDYNIKLHALQSCVATWVCALVCCKFLKDVRSGGWGIEGPKAPSLGQYLYACPNIPLGSGSIYLVLRLG